MTTESAEWQAKWRKGQWRTARKEHGCDAFFTKRCIGDGLIRKGERYFDTAELREWTSGPVFYRVCACCANASAEVAYEPPTPKFLNTEYVASFAA